MHRLAVVWAVLSFLLIGSGATDALHRSSHHAAGTHVAACCHDEADHPECPTQTHGHQHGDGQPDPDCPVCVALSLIISTPAALSLEPPYVALVSVRAELVRDLAPEPQPLDALDARPPPVA